MIEVRTATADEREAAAAIAAVQRFISETSSTETPAEPYSQWQRAALVEGVSAKGTVQDLKGGSKWLS
ncbi:MAG TPA: hypothetical protein VF176_03595 [Solirubrobacterales bacterium]